MPGKTWPPWNWIEGAALPLLGALTWSVWMGLPIAGLLDFVSEHHASPSAGGVVLLLLLGGSLAARFTRPLPSARWQLLLGGFAAVLVAEWAWLFRQTYAAWDPRWLAALAQQVASLSAGPILAAFIAAGLWRYGLTAHWENHDEFARAFIVGVLALGAGLVLAAVLAPGTAAQLVIAAVEFVVVAWAGLSLAGVNDASRSSSAEKAPRLNRYWLLAVATVVGVILVLGLLLTSLLTPQTLADLATLLQTLGDLTRTIFLAVLYVLSYAIFLVLTPLIEWLQRLFSVNKLPPLAPPVSPFTGQPTIKPATALVLPPVVELLVRAGVIIGLLLLVGWVLAWAMRRQTTTDEAGVRENREVMFSWDLLRAQLAGLMARQRPPELFPALAGSLHDPIVWLRHAYRRVLAQALARELPRQPQQTPSAYRPALDGLWPAEAEALAALTAAYSAARYGDVPPSAEQLALLQAALDRLAPANPGQPEVKGR